MGDQRMIGNRRFWLLGLAALAGHGCAYETVLGGLESVGQVSDQIDFGQVYVGTEARRELLVEVEGTAWLWVDGVVVGFERSDLAVNFNGGEKLAPGEVLSIPMVWRPTTAGDLAEQLTVQTRGSESREQVVSV